MSGWSFIEFFSSGRGQLVLAVAGLLLALVPLFKHYLVTPRRITYRVLYNSRIAFSAGNSSRQIGLHGGLLTDDPRARQVIKQLNGVSVAVIRVQNMSSGAIAPNDFTEPLSFTFGKRVVWSARVSEASNRVRDVLGDNMGFVGADDRPAAPVDPARRSAGAAGTWLSRWLRRPKASLPSAAGGPGVAVVDRSSRHGVQLNTVELKRKEKFTLVVVLHEPVEDGAHSRGQLGLDKTIDQQGHIVNGEVVDEKDQTVVTGPRMAGGVAILFFVALLVSVLIGPPDRDQSVRCAEGPLRVVGSSVFVPVVQPVAQQYSKVCDEGPPIETVVTGSKKGILELTDPPGGGVNPAELVVLHDGHRPGGPGPLKTHPIAVAIYSIAVNESVSSRGVKGLTSDELRMIWNGEVKFWDDLPGRASTGAAKLPIRIVSRSAASGSRVLFEERMLKGPEGIFTSDDCENRRAGVPDSTAIRCERDDNGAAIAEISTTPGAIGYVDLPPTNAQRKNRTVVPVSLDDVYPDISNIERTEGKGYQFWTVEQFYTKETPVEGTRLKHFLDYLTGPAGSTLIQAAGYIPCAKPDGGQHELCG